MKASSECRRRSQMITLNLGQKSTLLALVALCHSKRMSSKVKRALIVRQAPGDTHSSSAFSGGGCTDRQDMMKTMHALGDLPNLTSLTINLDGCRFPVSALAVLLKLGRERLKTLTLKDLVLAGNLCEENDLASALTESHHLLSLQTLSIENCQGTASIRTLLTKSSSLHTVTLRSSRLSQSDLWTSESLVEMCVSNPQLQSLTLDNVIGLDDHHLASFADYLGSTTETALKELHVISSCAGDVAGEALVRLLLVNKAISDVTLFLAGEWANCGSSVANLLSVNTTLRRLRVRLTRDALPETIDASEKAIQIARSLSPSYSYSTPSLEHLHLKLDTQGLDPLRCDDRQKILQQSFESALANNDTLRHLQLVDEDSSQYRLSPSLRMKLDLNKSGLARLLHPCSDYHQESTTSSEFMISYLTVMASSANNISVLFHALSNHPAMICNALKNYTVDATDVTNICTRRQVRGT